jgi:uncharacterized ferritin-like protein (DUF455 family)
MQATADVTSAPDPSSARARALAALCLTDPQAKIDATHTLQADSLNAALACRVDPGEQLTLPPGTRSPGRPGRPELIPPMQVPHRSPFTADGLAALVHAIAHIEFNAINLALDATWRFADMPEAFYRDWLRVADEEATHFGLLHEHLQSLGHDYGDFPAHDGLWEMCIKTQDDVTARMALVPRTLEARGLDATPLIQARLRKVGTPAAQRVVDILDIILRDEIGHVAVGNRWYGWLCAQQALDPLSHYRQLARQHAAPRLKPPFNDAARRAAGFSQPELEALHGT